MMRVLLTTLNAKYAHANLAIRSLAGYAQSPDWEIDLAEYTINDPILTVLGDICRRDPEVIGFSCYIWNISLTRELVRLIKQVCPAALIILGGPEVSYEAEQLLIDNPAVDVVVRGEGEETFCDLLTAVRRGGSLAEIPGLAYRDEDGVRLTPARSQIKDLNCLPFPYAGELPAALKNRVVYYESSRGCPFFCQYCLSSTTSGVRYMSLDRVMADLTHLINQGVRQINFVDRTFNCRRDHYWPIWRFLAAQGGDVEWHFEIVADLIDEEVLAWLNQVPAGRFRFEIGVQSTHPPTLSAISRQMDFARMARAVTEIRRQGKVFQHLDLIVGLPQETWPALAKSFNDVYSLRPDMLQLGFLKLLPGSGLRRDAQQHDYVYMANPPYEVLASKYLSYPEIRRLKIMEEVFERYYNSRRFVYSLEFALARHAAGPFDWYFRLAEYWDKRGWHLLSHNPARLGEMLAEFYRESKFDDYNLFCQVLKLDYLQRGGSAPMPAFLQREVPADWRYRRARFLGNDLMKGKYFPEYADWKARDLGKVLHLEVFDCDVTRLADDPASLAVCPEPTLILFKLGRNQFAKVSWEDFGPA